MYWRRQVELTQACIVSVIHTNDERVQLHVSCRRICSIMLDTQPQIPRENVSNKTRTYVYLSNLDNQVKARSYSKTQWVKLSKSHNTRVRGAVRGVGAKLIMGPKPRSRITIMLNKKVDFFSFRSQKA